MATGPAVDEWETISGGDDEWETIGPSVADQARQRLASRGLTPEMVKSGINRGPGEMRPATAAEGAISRISHAATAIPAALAGTFTAPADAAISFGRNLALSPDELAKKFESGLASGSPSEMIGQFASMPTTTAVNNAASGAAKGAQRAMGVPPEAITDTSEAVGTIVGTAVAPVAGKLASAGGRAIAQSQPVTQMAAKVNAARLSGAEGMANHFIKTTKSMFKFGKNPGEEIAGLKFNSPDELIPQLEQKMASYESQIDDLLSSPAAKTKAINSEAIIRQAFAEPIAVARRNGKDALADSLIQSRDARVAAAKAVAGRGWVNPHEATKIKQQIGHDTKWTQGQDETARTLNDALQDAYAGLDKAVDNAVPATASINRRYANAITAKKAAEALREAGQSFDPVSFLNPRTWLNNPAVRSRMAAGLKPNMPPEVLPVTQPSPVFPLPSNQRLLPPPARPQRMLPPASVVEGEGFVLNPPRATNAPQPVRGPGFEIQSPEYMKYVEEILKLSRQR